ncbi:MAG: hypothetical protein V4623_06595 [Pseudomonadota bacterium]
MRGVSSSGIAAAPGVGVVEGMQAMQEKNPAPAAAVFRSPSGVPVRVSLGAGHDSVPLTPKHRGDGWGAADPCIPLLILGAPALPCRSFEDRLSLTGTQSSNPNPFPGKVIGQLPATLMLESRWAYHKFGRQFPGGSLGTKLDSFMKNHSTLADVVLEQLLDAALLAFYKRGDEQERVARINWLKEVIQKEHDVSENVNALDSAMQRSLKGSSSSSSPLAQPTKYAAPSDSTNEQSPFKKPRTPKTTKPPKAPVPQ